MACMIWDEILTVTAQVWGQPRYVARYTQLSGRTNSLLSTTQSQSTGVRTESEIAIIDEWNAS